RSSPGASRAVAPATSASSRTPSSARERSRSCPTWRRISPMKVILLDDVAKVGRRGEVRDVSDGYARNFLIPKKLALTATPGTLKNLEHIKRQQDAKADRVKADAESLRAKIEALVYEERRQAS